MIGPMLVNCANCESCPCQDYCIICLALKLVFINTDKKTNIFISLMAQLKKIFNLLFHQNMMVEIKYTHLSTAVAWREKKFKNFVFKKYFSLTFPARF